MKELNMKMPLVFRLGIALLCVMLLSTHFMGNLYARYSTTATGSDSARVAKISYDITHKKESSHSVDVNDFDDNTIIAIEETFEITNNGEVTFEYVINDLYFKNDFPSGYQFTTEQDTIYLLPASGGTQKGASLVSYTGQFAGAKLYFSINGVWSSLPADDEDAKITNTLPIGATDTITFLYFVVYQKMSEDTFDASHTIICDITCFQID